MKTKYNLQKIKQLPKFEDVLKKKLKDPEFKKGFELAKKRIELSHEIMMARKQAKLTQKEMAKKLNTSQGFIARIENGAQNFTIDILNKIALTLNKDLKISLR